MAVQFIPLMDLRVDFACKQLFGQPHSREILIALLQALLKRSGKDRIVDVIFPTEKGVRDENDRDFSRFTVIGYTECGERMQITMQIPNQFEMNRYTLHFWSESQALWARERSSCDVFQHSIVINVLDFNYIESMEDYHTSFQVSNNSQYSLQSDVVEVHFVELPKLRAKREAKLCTLKLGSLERWLSLFDAAEDESIRQMLQEAPGADPLIDQALLLWDRISRVPNNRRIYVYRQKTMQEDLSLQRDFKESLRLHEDVQKLLAETEKNRAIMQRDLQIAIAFHADIQKRRIVFEQLLQDTHKEIELTKQILNDKAYLQ